jgi:hypothetical protein
MRRLWFIIAMLIAGEALAMKVRLPEKTVFKDSTGTVALTVFANAPPKLVAPGQKHTWPKRLVQPSSLLISTSAKTVVFIGGYGDPGVDLGIVRLYDYAGAELATIDLTKELPDLEALSKTWQDNMGNFPWIGSAALSTKGDAVTIDVCHAYDVTVELPKGTHAVHKRDASAPPAR